MDAGSKEVSANYCGKCYGATPPASGCCNTCDEVREAYAKMGWALKGYEDIEQCVKEGWAEKLDFDKGEGALNQGHGSVDPEFLKVVRLPVNSLSTRSLVGLFMPLYYF